MDMGNCRARFSGLNRRGCDIFGRDRHVRAFSRCVSGPCDRTGHHNIVIHDRNPPA